METIFFFPFPVFVTLLLFILSGGRVSWVPIAAVVLAIAGVAELSLQGTTLRLDPYGVVIVLLSALGYASYIVTVNKSRVRNMHSRKLAFYVFAFTTLAFLAKTGFGEGIQPVHGAWPVFNIIMLAVAPTVISNITLLLAVRNIGGTLTSILGALEPVTAVCIGVLFFGVALTFNEGVGVVVLLAAVSLFLLG